MDMKDLDRFATCLEDVVRVLRQNHDTLVKVVVFHRAGRVEEG